MWGEFQKRFHIRYVCEGCVRLPGRSSRTAQIPAALLVANTPPRIPPTPALMLFIVRSQSGTHKILTYICTPIHPPNPPHNPQHTHPLSNNRSL